MGRAIQVYMVETGNATPDGNSGELHGDLLDYIRESKFEQPTPLGGVYDTENPGGDAGALGGVGVDFGADYPGDDIMIEIDAMIDDGSLDSGMCQKFGSDRYYLLLPEQ